MQSLPQSQQMSQQMMQSLPQSQQMSQQLMQSLPQSHTPTFINPQHPRSLTHVTSLIACDIKPAK